MKILSILGTSCLLFQLASPRAFAGGCPSDSSRLMLSGIINTAESLKVDKISKGNLQSFCYDIGDLQGRLDSLEQQLGLDITNPKADHATNMYLSFGLSPILSNVGELAAACNSDDPISRKQSTVVQEVSIIQSKAKELESLVIKLCAEKE